MRGEEAHDSGAVGEQRGGDLDVAVEHRLRESGRTGLGGGHGEEEGERGRRRAGTVSLASTSAPWLTKRSTRAAFVAKCSGKRPY